ncbi:MAG: DnaJ domain-containing protein [Pseudomonadales bacterium]
MALGSKKLTVRQFFFIYLGALGGLGLIYLGLSGRLHWLFALLGAALPFMGRLLPFALKLINAIYTFKWLKQFGWSGSGAAHQASGQQSELNTRFLAMSLDHDSGEMDGRVLEGPFKGMRLSEMNLEQLIDLHKQCRQDPDSLNVLQAYLDRIHPDWDTHQDAGARNDDTNDDTSDSGNVNERQAWEILGLEPGATRQEIVDAHRRLIQKLHPDRGGSNYLASRINEAKRVLLGDKNKGSNR